MITLESDFMHAVITGIRQITEELHKMNKLKAIEIKMNVKYKFKEGHQDEFINEVDEVVFN